ncbi:hypothetical protein HDV06_000718 [Boothiomyces sp. JEL0866]|nr:hypothetical protein HDV06_000718 [Boothiomyces sp. JEL0866]
MEKEKLTGIFFICSDVGYKSFLFIEFQIKNKTKNQVLFHVKRPDAIKWEDNDTNETEARVISYQFPKDFLDAKEIQTKLVFAVGPKEIKNLRMIERHYFKEKLLRSYDFTFGFCIPNTVNTWESSYEMPELDKDTKNEIIKEGNVVSDSFYFIDNKLVLQNKASYSYV